MAEDRLLLRGVVVDEKLRLGLRTGVPLTSEATSTAYRQLTPMFLKLTGGGTLQEIDDIV